MTTMPANLNGYAMLIPPDQQVNYVGAGLQIAIGSTGDAGVRYFSDDNHGEFTWSFMGYDTVTIPPDSGLQSIPFGIDIAGWVVESVFSTFFVSDSHTDLPPVPVTITDRSGARVLVTESAERLGVAIEFNDPSLPRATVTWGEGPLPTLL